MCATGTEALRGAAYAVASGAVDIALAIGAEKLKDTGFGGLPPPFKGTFNDLWMPMGSAPAGFAQLADGYRTTHRRLERGLEAGDRPRHLEEPPERRLQPQGTFPQGRVDGDHPQRADDRRAAGPVRLFRRVGWRGLRDRDHAGDRPGAGQEGHRHDQGAPALDQFGQGDAAVGLGRQPSSATRARRSRRLTRKPASPSPRSK